jgi:hypothetical protein
MAHVSTLKTEKERPTRCAPVSLSFVLIVHSIPGLVATMTPKGDLELVNQPVQDYTGLAFDALKDWPATGLVPEEELPRVAARVETVGGNRMRV